MLSAVFWTQCTFLLTKKYWRCCDQYTWQSFSRICFTILNSRMVLIFSAHSPCFFVACRLHNLHCGPFTSPSWFSAGSCWWFISSQKKDVKKVNSEAISATKALDSILTAWRCTRTGIKIWRDERLEALNDVVHVDSWKSHILGSEFYPVLSFFLVCVKKPRFLVIITLYSNKILGNCPQPSKFVIIALVSDAKDLLLYFGAVLMRKWHSKKGVGRKEYSFAFLNRLYSVLILSSDQTHDVYCYHILMCIWCMLTIRGSLRHKLRLRENLWPAGMMRSSEAGGRIYRL